MITELTPKQKSLIPIYRDKWLNKFYSLPEIDKDKCRQGIEWLYEFCGYKKPLIIFAKSPMGCQIMANVLIQMSKNKKMKIESGIRSQIDSKIRSKIDSEIWSKIGSKIRSKIDSGKILYISFSWYANILDYSWCAYVQYYMDNQMIPENDNFRKFVDMLDSGIYDMIQLEGICIVSPMPKHLNINEQKKLHSECGSCVEWSDGYKIYALEGVILDESLYRRILKKEITPKEIMGLDNKEKQMIAMKYYGFENMLEDVKAKKINTGKHKYYFSTDLKNQRTQNYDLYQVDNIFSDTEYFLVYDCPSTGRRYCSCMSTMVKENQDCQELALLCAARKRGLTLDELKNNIFIES